MNDLDEVWAYDEPHYSGGSCHITMTKRQAIEWTRKVYFGHDSYRDATDEQIFQEFVVVHWAYKEKEKDNAKVE